MFFKTFFFVLHEIFIFANFSLNQEKQQKATNTYKNFFDAYLVGFVVFVK